MCEEDEESQDRRQKEQTVRLVYFSCRQPSGSSSTAEGDIFGREVASPRTRSPGARADDVVARQDGVHWDEQRATWRRLCGVWSWGLGTKTRAHPASRLLLSREPTDMSSNTNQTPKSDDSPGNAAEQRDEELWSGEDDYSDPGVADGADGAGKRKRQKTSRPLSVSCELCKSRKVCVIDLTYSLAVADQR